MLAEVVGEEEVEVEGVLVEEEEAVDSEEKNTKYN